MSKTRTLKKLLSDIENEYLTESEFNIILEEIYKWGTPSDYRRAISSRQAILKIQLSRVEKESDSEEKELSDIMEMQDPIIQDPEESVEPFIPNDLPEPVKPEPVKPEPVKPEPVKPEPVKHKPLGCEICGSKTKKPKSKSHINSKTHQRALLLK